MSGAGLAHILGGDGPILLDFDGPVCSIFAGYPASVVASELRGLAVNRGVQLSAEIAAVDDPLQILRWTDTLRSRELIEATEDALRAAELAAVATASPAPHSEQLFVAAHRAKRQIAIVSNNSAPAIHAYLDAHGLSAHVAGVTGRKPCNPQKMKPNPYLIEEALAILRAMPRDAVLIGDSLTDITASHRAGVRIVGYADKPGKLESFSAAGADAVVTTLADVVAVLAQEQGPTFKS